jgi:inosose dehydratase
MERRAFLASLAGLSDLAARSLPANRNIKWALSAGLWSHYPPVRFTDILDIMRDTGFVGIRLTGYPGILKTYNITASQLEVEISKRNLYVTTISFGGPTNDSAQHQRIVEKARQAMRFLKGFGANRLVVFPPSRMRVGQNVNAGFRVMCKGFDLIGEAANEMDFKAGVHNHLGTMVQGPEEVHRCMEMTDPKLFNFAPDTAHLYLGGSNVVEMFERYKSRLVFMDYKDARWTTPQADVVLPNGKVLRKNTSEAKFFDSIYDLGDGNIDFPACHRILRQIHYEGWICVDLDRTRKGPLASYRHCDHYIVNRLQPIYF